MLFAAKKHGYGYADIVPAGHMDTEF